MEPLDLINRLAQRFEEGMSPKTFEAWMSLSAERRKQILFGVFVDATPIARQRLSK